MTLTMVQSFTRNFQQLISSYQHPMCALYLITHIFIISYPNTIKSTIKNKIKKITRVVPITIKFYIYFNSNELIPVCVSTDTNLISNLISNKVHSHPYSHLRPYPSNPIRSQECFTDLIVQTFFLKIFICISYLFLKKIMYLDEIFSRILKSFIYLLRFKQ